MTDLTIIVAIILTTTFSTIYQEQRIAYEIELNDCAQTNALIWEEGMTTTDLLKQCQRRKKR